LNQSLAETRKNSAEHRLDFRNSQRHPGKKKMPTERRFLKRRFAFYGRGSSGEIAVGVSVLFPRESCSNGGFVHQNMLQAALARNNLEVIRDRVSIALWEVIR
jgi:hypothetical protein